MSKRKTLWLGGLCIGLVGLAVLVVFVLSVGTRQPSATPAPQESVSVPVGTDIGEQAPDFTLTDIDGNKFSLSELRGQACDRVLLSVVVSAVCAGDPRAGKAQSSVQKFRSGLDQR
jgi:hypothetical protein